MRRAASPLAEVALKWSWDQWISCGWGNWWLTRPGLQQERDAEAYASWLALGEAAILRVLSHNAGQIFIYLPAESPAGEPKRHMGTHDNQEIEQLLQTAQKHETFAAWDHAAAAYAQALALRSDDARLHSRYGAIREELGRWDEAERSYQAARTADPGNPDTRYNLGMFYRERGRAAEAITELRAFLASGPQREAATEVMDTLAELGAPTQLCGNCGCVSPLTKLFHALWGAGVLCPRCYIKHTQGQAAQAHSRDCIGGRRACPVHPAPDLGRLRAALPARQRPFHRTCDICVRRRPRIRPRAGRLANRRAGLRDPVRQWARLGQAASRQSAGAHPGPTWAAEAV